ncbi:uncharacterized protein NPIL_231861 [Nephila pilipes]|uniref:Uncharacterized protein n=1 Tax=Nephila pilipes TaxID=299642 RepID=A0A8X6Q7X2_NEPPI|nr:uncharacterized protein NPIL_231861 [Nephila pilipes]
MQHAKKFVLIPEDQLIKNTPSQQQMTEFDHQMSKILNSKLPDYEKMQRYYELLRRKMNLQDYNLPGIAYENHAFEDEHPVQKDEPVKLKGEIKPKVDENYMSIILESVPKTYKNQASTLLNILKDKPNILSWNEQGEVFFRDKKYQQSNLADLFNMIFTNRKSSTITAKEEFLQTLQELNTPRHYIKNKYLKTPFVKQEILTLPVKRKQYVKPVVKRNRLDEKPKYDEIHWESF